MVWTYVSQLNLNSGLLAGQHGTEIQKRLLVLWATSLTLAGALLTESLIRWREHFEQARARSAVRSASRPAPRPLSYSPGCSHAAAQVSAKEDAELEVDKLAERLHLQASVSAFVHAAAGRDEGHDTHPKPTPTPAAQPAASATPADGAAAAAGCASDGISSGRAAGSGGMGGSSALQVEVPNAARIVSFEATAGSSRKAHLPSPGAALSSALGSAPPTPSILGSPQPPSPSPALDSIGVVIAWLSALQRALRESARRILSLTEQLFFFSTGWAWTCVTASPHAAHGSMPPTRWPLEQLSAHFHSPLPPH